MKEKLLNFLDPVYDRVVKVSYPPIFYVGDKFTLTDGYYSNREETLVFKSNDKTGYIFSKEARGENETKSTQDNA